jgi:hypothetical protein
MRNPSFLGFETNVLARIEFDSMTIPFCERPELAVAMKRRGKRVTANSVYQSTWTRNLAAIQNNTERLSKGDLEIVLHEAYVPGYKLQNPALRNWFGESDAWWFDNVRRKLDELASPHLFALGASLAMDVGDYVLSFDEQTRELRQPLSRVYERLWRNTLPPINNSQNNSCQNRNDNEFLAESFVELLYLHIPTNNLERESTARWREEWLRGNIDFWDELDRSQAGRVGSPVRSRSHFLWTLEETLSIASNIKHWAISIADGGFISVQEAVDTVNRLRHVDKIYSKDFSELTGVKATIITA